MNCILQLIAGDWCYDDHISWEWFSFWKVKSVDPLLSTVNWGQTKTFLLKVGQKKTELIFSATAAFFWYWWGWRWVICKSLAWVVSKHARHCLLGLKGCAGVQEDQAPALTSIFANFSMEELARFNWEGATAPALSLFHLTTFPSPFKNSQPSILESKEVPLYSGSSSHSKCPPQTSGAMLVVHVLCRFLNFFELRNTSN